MRDPNYAKRIAAARPADAGAELRPPGAEEAANDITRDTKAFTAAIRNRIFTFLRGLVIGEFETALEGLLGAPLPLPSSPMGARESGTQSPNSEQSEAATEPIGNNVSPALSPTEAERENVTSPWSPERLQQAIDGYLTTHQQLLLTPEARNLRHTYVTPSEDKKTWRVQQMLVDPEAHNDWVAEFSVDLARSREAREPAMQLCRLGPLV
jgi:hypothetical protein